MERPRETCGHERAGLHESDSGEKSSQNRNRERFTAIGRVCNHPGPAWTGQNLKGNSPCVNISWQPRLQPRSQRLQRRPLRATIAAISASKGASSRRRTSRSIMMRPALLTTAITSTIISAPIRRGSAPRTSWATTSTRLPAMTSACSASRPKSPTSVRTTRTTRAQIVWLPTPARAMAAPR